MIEKPWDLSLKNIALCVALHLIAALVIIAAATLLGEIAYLMKFLLPSDWSLG